MNAKFEKLLPWFAVGVGVVLVSRLLNFGKSAADALTETGEALGSGLYDFFHKSDMGEMNFFVATFPDKTRHSIPAGAVTEDGFFANSNLAPNYKGDGMRYRLVKNKATGLFVAVPG